MTLKMLKTEMKIYTVTVDMLLVLSRLRNFDLKEFNDVEADIFVAAHDPDDACYNTYCLLSEILLKQDESVETALLIKEVLKDIRIKKIVCKDEKKL